MKKKTFSLRTPTDIKVFLLFLLENIRYPIDRSTLIEIISENTEEIIMDYDECLGELSDTGHVWFDEMDGELYYMISDSGRLVARELVDSLDKEFRERSLKSAIKHLSLSKSGAKVKSLISENPTGGYSVTMTLTSETGELMSVSLSVSSRAEAEKIKSNFETRPESVYRGIFFSATGRIEYIS